MACEGQAAFTVAADGSYLPGPGNNDLAVRREAPRSRP
jgi:hypothetical protein